jgi:hypothetical protein
MNLKLKIGLISQGSKKVSKEYLSFQTYPTILNSQGAIFGTTLYQQNIPNHRFNIH